MTKQSYLEINEQKFAKIYLKFTHYTYPIYSMTWNVVQSSSHDDSTACTLDNTYKWMTYHFYFNMNGQEFAKVL